MPRVRLPDGKIGFVPYEPHANQRPIHSSNAQIKALHCGRRFGKTYAVINDSLMRIDELARTRWIDPSGVDRTADLYPQIHMWVVCANYEQTDKVIRDTRNQIPPWWFLSEREASEENEEKQKKYQFSLAIRNEDMTYDDDVVRRNCLIEFKSGHNAQLLEGVGPDILYMFEAHNIPDDAYNTVNPAMISAGRAGIRYYDGVPPLSPAHWFAREFKTAVNDQSGRSEAFRYATYQNPLLSLDQLWQAYYFDKKTMPTMEWQRYYEVIQPQGTGQYFKKIDKATRGSELTEPIPGRRYVGGIDWGRNQDHTVLIIKDAENAHSVYARAWTNHESYSRVIPEVCAILKHFGVTVLKSDTTGGAFTDSHRILLNTYGLNVSEYQFSTQGKHNLYEYYAIGLDHEAVSFPSHWQELIEQLLSIEVKPSKVAHTFRYQPVGPIKDDWVDAECLAYMACDPMQVNREEMEEIGAKMVADPMVFDDWGYADTSYDEFEDPIEIYKERMVYSDVVKAVNDYREAALKAEM